VPTFWIDYVYIDPDLRERAGRWLDNNRSRIIPAANTGGEEV
jgi:hypothetical protein